MLPKLAPGRTVAAYGVPDAQRSQFHVPAVMLGAHLLFNCAIVGLTIVVPVMDNSFVYGDGNAEGDATIRRQAYATGASVLALAHLWAYLNKEVSKRGGSDVTEGLLFLMNCLLACSFLVEQNGAVLTGTIALALFCFGLLFFPKQFVTLLWQYDNKFFQDEVSGPYLVLLNRGIGLALVQSVVLVSCLELNKSPIQSFGLSCIALTTGVLSLPLWNCNAAKISLTARHLAMGTAGAVLSSFMILQEPLIPASKSQE